MISPETITSGLALLVLVGKTWRDVTKGNHREASATAARQTTAKEFGQVVEVAILRSEQRTSGKMDELRDTVTQRIEDLDRTGRDARAQIWARLEEVSTAATETDHIVRGVDGANGTRGDLRKMDRRVAELERRAPHLPSASCTP